jgi:isopentenyl-diphosphate Delta-isomerase
MEEVILVNERDEQTGLMEKMEAHRKGVLHRAFSVLVFNTKGELLLQRRALHKYHSPGLWTNTCCSHPRNGESIIDAAKRRLHEEMGMSCELKIKGSFIYKTELEGGLTEHEYDYVLTGISNDLPVINQEEVSEFKYMKPEELKIAMDEHPENYTFWIREMNNRKLM